MTIGPWSLTLGEWATVVALIGVLFAAGKWMLEPRLKTVIKDAMAPDISKIGELVTAMTKLSDGLSTLSEEMRLFRIVDILTSDLPAETPAEIKLAIARARFDPSRVIEHPLGSNRGPEIDEYNREAGVAMGSPWCASAAGKWWKSGGLDVPKGYALCANWTTWAKATGRWSTTPALGAMVLYQHGGVAHHIGLIVFVGELVLSIEGNTSIETGYSREGLGVGLKIVDPKTDPVLGYVLPFPKVSSVAAPAA